MVTFLTGCLYGEVPDIKLLAIVYVSEEHSRVGLLYPVLYRQ